MHWTLATSGSWTGQPFTLLLQQIGVQWLPVLFGLLWFTTQPGVPLGQTKRVNDFSASNDGGRPGCCAGSI